MSPNTSIISDEQKKRHDQLFKINHVLSPKNLNIDTPRNKSASFNDSLDLSTDINLTPITHEQVENDPKTPFYREEFVKRRSSSNSFSPIPTTTKKGSFGSDVFQSTPSNINLHRRAFSNRALSYSSGSDKDAISTPTQDKVVSKIPNSILKKSINYDRDTSNKIVKLRPELSSALNSEGELNPLKASKAVVISPKKEYFGGRSSYAKSSKFASPLTDALNGRSKKNLKSPYVSGSPKKKSKSADQEWIDENEDEDEVNKKDKSRKKKKTPVWKRVLRSLVDPQLPYVLSLYLQLLFNVAIVSILLYFVYSFISTVRADVENKVDSYATDILQEIALCSREYIRNNCQPGQRVVALEGACSEWEKCMNRDPTTVGRAKIGAETFAEIINGFIKPISWKSMFFLLLITVGSLVLTNAAFGTYRNYSHYDQQQYPQQQAQQVPQTPHKTPYESIQYNPNYTRYYTPKASSPTNLAIVRHKQRSSKKPKKLT